MALIVYHDTQVGIQRLLTSMLDLGVYSAWYNDDRPLSEAGGVFQSIFSQYRQFIRQVYNEAVPWWEGTIQSVRDQGVPEKEAIEIAFNNRMAGAASYPRTAWIVRLVWLKCAELNSQVPDSEKVRPECILLQWLIDEGETELVRFIACMPYWPIGLDENGNWC